MVDLVSFTLKRNLRINMRRTRLLGLFAAASLFWLTVWFHIHLFLFISEKPEEMTETLAHGTPLTAQQELCNEYQHDRVKVVFIIFCCFVHWTKVLFI